MTLGQALDLINSRKGSGGKTSHFLACGFEPLHLETLFRAHLLERLPGSDVEVCHGVYGDLPGNLRRAGESPATAAAAIVEWSDIDPRLGLRGSRGWSGETKDDIVASFPNRCAQLTAAIEKLAGRMPVAVAPPGLPLPPIGNTIGAQASELELELKRQLAAFLLGLSRLPGVRVAQLAPGESRLDAKMELLAGFPYTIPYAAALAKLLVDVLYQPAPKKGLITDLDDTLWAGIVGEVGADGVSWQQETHRQSHGLYQQMLGHLASCGVLLGVCSKNEMATVEAALARSDLFLDARSLFPVIANWGPKSSSVARILRAWNIAEDAVVFVDDSPMELEEVRQAFPGITCRRFNGKDAAAVWALMTELRDLFGKPVLTEEDRIRQAGIRASSQIQELGEAAGSPEFLRSLEGSVTVQWRTDPADKRPLELINKTNQFNLNGLRISEGEWQRRLEAPETLLAVASYQDKFGLLGKVAVLLGSRLGSQVKVSHWVMSCRAFSRRLEHHTLESLFRHTGADQIDFAFQETAKNQPLREFFHALGIRPLADGEFTITRARFESAAGILPHKLSDPDLR